MTAGRTGRQSNVLGRVQAHFEAGNTGTVREICQALGLHEGSVVCALRRLREADQADQVGTKIVQCAVGYSATVDREVAVWGAIKPREPVDSAELVRTALGSRHPIELAWIGGLPQCNAEAH